MAVRRKTNLNTYWQTGKGGRVKVKWNTPGDFTRCVRHLRGKVRNPEGYCALRHKRMTGMWPGDKRNRRRKR